MCTVVWSIRLPRVYDRMYRVIDDVYLAYGVDGDRCMVSTRGEPAEYFDVAGELAIARDYEYTVTIRGVGYSFDYFTDGTLGLLQSSRTGTVYLGQRLTIDDTCEGLHYGRVIHILWHSDTDFIIKCGRTLARIHVDWDHI